MQLRNVVIAIILCVVIGIAAFFMDVFDSRPADLQIITAVAGTKVIFIVALAGYVPGTRTRYDSGDLEIEVCSLVILSSACAD